MHPAGVESGIIITATVMNTLSDDLVLPSTTAKCLDEMSTSFSVNATTRSQTHNEVENQQNGESTDELQEFVDPDFSTRGQGLSENSLDSESCTQLISEQEVDPSLKQCLSLAKHGKGNLCMHNGILMHYERILRQNYRQLVVPSSRCPQCLEFGHDLGVISPQRRSLTIFA